MSERVDVVNLHQVILEEVLELPLGGRICEVSNVESPSLSGAGKDSLVLGCGGLSTSVVGIGLVEGGSGQLGGNTIVRCGHFCKKFMKLMTRIESKRAEKLTKLGVLV